MLKICRCSHIAPDVRLVDLNLQYTKYQEKQI